MAGWIGHWFLFQNPTHLSHPVMHDDEHDENNGDDSWWHEIDLDSWECWRKKTVSHRAHCKVETSPWGWTFFWANTHKGVRKCIGRSGPIQFSTQNTASHTIQSHHGQVMNPHHSKLSPRKIAYSVRTNGVFFMASAVSIIHYLWPHLVTLLRGCNIKKVRLLNEIACRFHLPLVNLSYLIYSQLMPSWSCRDTLYHAPTVLGTAWHCMALHAVGNWNPNATVGGLSYRSCVQRSKARKNQSESDLRPNGLLCGLGLCVDLLQQFIEKSIKLRQNGQGQNACQGSSIARSKKHQ